MDNLIYIPARLKLLHRIIDDLEWEDKDCQSYKAERDELEAALGKGILYTPNF